jgi:hypothetical protein
MDLHEMTSQVLVTVQLVGRGGGVCSRQRQRRTQIYLRRGPYTTEGCDRVRGGGYPSQAFFLSRRQRPARRLNRPPQKATPAEGFCHSLVTHCELHLPPCALVHND